MADLDRQIEEERTELRNAPVATVSHGAVQRCHLCGQPTRDAQELETTDTPYGKLTRIACKRCRP